MRKYHFIINSQGYHPLTRADTVLTGRNVRMHPQSPWKCASIPGGLFVA